MSVGEATLRTGFTSVTEVTPVPHQRGDEAAPELDAPARRPTGRHRGPRRGAAAGLTRLLRTRHDMTISTVAVVVVTLILWRHSLAHLMTWSQAANGEEGQYLFWLAHFPHAVLGGHSPLHAGNVNAPDGLNATWNTSVLTPALLLAPVTLLAGPVLAYNLAVMLAMAGTAGSCVAACRRFVTWWPAALAGGCLAGFGPYAVVQSQGHLNISLVAVPALLVLVGHELCVRQGTRPRTLGLLLGVLLALQFGISTETLASCGVLGLVALAVLVPIGWHRGQVTAVQLRYVAGSLAVAAVTTLVLLALPLWELLAGPQHLSGPVQATAAFSADLLSPVLPTSQQRLAPPSVVAHTAAFSGNVVENTAYVGIPLLVLVVVAVVRLRHRPAVLWAGSLALVSLVLSLGPSLRVDGHDTGVPLPYALLDHVPPLDSAAPVRYSYATLLFAAIVAAVALDAGVAAMRRGPRRPAALGAVAALVAMPLLPAGPAVYVSQPLDVPTFYTSGLVRAAVPANGVVVSYPYLNRFETLPLTELALAGVRYRQLGVYGFTPAPGSGAGRFDVPTATAYAESRIALGVQPDPARSAAVLAELASRQVGAVFVDLGAGRAADAVAFWTALLGHGPVIGGGVASWRT